MITARATLLVGLFLAGGCGELETKYGDTTGNTGRKSIAGFGVLREYYRQNGWTDRTVRRLNERLNNVDTIVWIPDSDLPPDLAATQWFEEWLARGDKTLVYILRDHQTDYDYWRQASRLAPPAQRLEYRRREARADLNLRRELLTRPNSISNGWFIATPLQPPTTIGRIDPIDTEVMATEVLPSDPKTDGRKIEFQLAPYGKAAVTAANAAGGTTGTGQMMRGFREYSPTTTEVNFETVLETVDGTSVVAEVTHDEWYNSSIVVVSAGSLLTNYGLTYPESQKLAEELLALSSYEDDDDSPKVGFLTTGVFGVDVSSLDPENAGPTGMELFTTWPLSVITIHAFVFGTLVCLMLLPIFGRPRRLPPKPSADFADHIDAVAGLMQRSRGTHYAKLRISEYMVRVRGETEGPWVLPPPDPNVPPERVKVEPEPKVPEPIVEVNSN